jgi:hypothetical protein
MRSARRSRPGHGILRLNSGEQRRFRRHAAWRPSARCPTRTTATSTTARPAVHAGRASARMSAVLHEPGRPPARRWRRAAPPVVRHPVTPWGKPTKGKRTRSNKSTDKFIMRSRHAAQEVREGSPQWLVQFGKVRLLTAIFSRRPRRFARRPQRRDQDLEPPLHHHAAVRRTDLRRLQRKQAHSGQRVRRHGRSQVRRIRPTRTYYGHGADKKAKRK